MHNNGNLLGKKSEKLVREVFRINSSDWEIKTGNLKDFLRHKKLNVKSLEWQTVKDVQVQFKIFDRYLLQSTRIRVCYCGTYISTTTWYELSALCRQMNWTCLLKGFWDELVVCIRTVRDRQQTQFSDTTLLIIFGLKKRISS